MDFQIEQTGQCRELKFTGNLTIYHAQDIQQALRTFLEKVDHLVVNFEGTTEVDISCLQVLCAAHRSCMKAGKRLTLKGKSRDFQKAIELAGYGRNIGCVIDVDNSCLWTKDRTE